MQNRYDKPHPMDAKIAILTDPAALDAFCQRALGAPFVTVDTEFMRERSYYAKLCLVQLAIPSAQSWEAVLIDPLAPAMDLAPLYRLFKAPSVTKVFHAARQDLEIFYLQGGVIPTPLFDTQVAAMVCDHGQQVGYETLVRRIVKTDLDKSSQFTDWARRPLSEKQKAYALADVTHLQAVYRHLARALETSGRTSWVEEEMAVLRDPATYRIAPQDAWRRLKVRTSQPRFLAIVRELAHWRENLAQRRNVPRARVLSDDALMELAAVRPEATLDLARARLLPQDMRKGARADEIVAAVSCALALPVEELPQVSKGKARKPLNAALADLLRVLLKVKAVQAGVAQKLIATSADLDDIASGNREGLWCTGWRAEVFGNDALRLCQGCIALSWNGNTIEIVEV